jgi:alanyl-tRNA synthetase
MKLKQILTTAPEAAIAQFYTQQGDKWVLDLEGDGAPDPKLTEFRDRNVTLVKEREELLAKLKAAEESAQKAAPKVKESESLAEEVKRLKEEWQNSQQKTVAAEQRAREEQFRGSFLQTATKHKVRDETAAKVLLAMAKQTYKEKEGAFIPLAEDGRPLYSKKDVTAPMPIEEWIEAQKAGEYRDLFAQPSGGGAKGSAGSLIGNFSKTVPMANMGNFIDEVAKGEVGVHE